MEVLLLEKVIVELPLRCKKKIANFISKIAHTGEISDQLNHMKRHEHGRRGLQVSKHC